MLARQFGLISRAQAISVGVTRRMIDGRLASGQWETAAPGVYRASIVPRTFRQRCLAASLWAAPDGLVSHLAAGALWRLEGVGRPELISVTFPGAGRRRSRRFDVRSSSDLGPADRDGRGPISVTSALRTMIDLAGTLDPVRFEVALEDGLRRRLFTAGQLRWRIATRAGKGIPGSDLLGRLARRDDLGRTDSGWEVRTAQVLVDAGLPAPERQLGVATHLGLLHVDLGYRGPPVVAVEYDSDQWHSGVARRHRDAARRNALRAAGCHVIEVTPSTLRERGLLVALVREAVHAVAG